MAKYRDHNSNREAADKSEIEVADMVTLLAHMRKQLTPYSFEFVDGDVVVLPYATSDKPTQQIVTINGYGPMGYLSEPIPYQAVVKN